MKKQLTLIISLNIILAVGLAGRAQSQELTQPTNASTPYAKYEAKIIFDEDTALNILSDILGGQTGATYSSRDKLYQEYLGQLSEEYSNNSALSLEGQSKIEAKVNSAVDSAEQSLTMAENSSGQDVSQNIMRNIFNQLALLILAKDTIMLSSKAGNLRHGRE